jgi:hypothetical protein
MSGGARSSDAEAHSGNESSWERELDAVSGLCHDPRFKNLCGAFHSARSRHSGLARRRGLDLGTFDDLVHDVKLMRFASGLSRLSGLLNRDRHCTHRVVIRYDVDARTYWISLHPAVVRLSHGRDWRKLRDPRYSCRIGREVFERK